METKRGLLNLWFYVSAFLGVFLCYSYSLEPDCPEVVTQISSRSTLPEAAKVKPISFIPERFSKEKFEIIWMDNCKASYTKNWVAGSTSWTQSVLAMTGKKLLSIKNYFDDKECKSIRPGLAEVVASRSTVRPVEFKKLRKPLHRIQRKATHLWKLKT